MTRAGRIKGGNIMTDSLKRGLYILGTICLYFILTMLPTPEGLSPEGQKAIALMLCAVITWSMKLLPIAVSSILFTCLTVVVGLVPFKKSLSLFATPPIFFVFAMFCNAIAFQNSGLNKRIVLWTSIKSKGNPRKLILYLMMATALISSFLADIPAIAMMYPVGLLLLQENGCEPGKSNLGRVLMLGLPLASLIGGAGTPAGSSMNVLTLSLLQSTSNIHISFFEWSMMGMPIVLLLTPVTCYILLKFYPPEIDTLVGIEKVHEQYESLGVLSKKEYMYLIILIINMVLWMTDSIHRIPLPVIAVLGISLFFIPGIDLVSWSKDNQKIGWDILMLVGASSALGMIIWEKGGAMWIANTCLSSIADFPVSLIIASICLFTIVIHLLIPENTAIVAVLLPTLTTFATMHGINPGLLTIPMGLSVSANLLLPLGPVPLITFPAGYYKMYDLFLPGSVISIAWILLVTIIMLFIAIPTGIIS